MYKTISTPLPRDFKIVRDNGKYQVVSNSRNSELRVIDQYGCARTINLGTEEKMIELFERRTLG